MEACSLCNGRVTQTEYGPLCLNDKCPNSKESERKGLLCGSCHETLVFKRNSPYGDPIYVCPGCRKEIST